jgi:DNA-binding winged helix-turn-helix (wHTH) protein
VPPVYAFGSFRFDPAQRALTGAHGTTNLTDRQSDVLACLIARRGEVVSKDELIETAWGGIAVTDNSLERVISDLRRLLGDTTQSPTFIQTVARRGYRFRAEVTDTRAARAPDTAIEALLEPYRAWVQGRTALETLERDAVEGARAAFARAVKEVPDYAPAHLGLANACLMHFESTRADERPDLDVLTTASHHAREACRLDSASGEAWATLAFALHHTGAGMEAMAAARRAVSLEADNWRHHLRLAYVSWGEERLRAARRTLALMPGLALAHWLAATVHVGRQAFESAARQLEAGSEAQDRQLAGRGPFRAVGLHLLRGLVLFARDDTDAAMDGFRRELEFESTGQLYGRECAANTWHAVGGVHLSEHRVDEAIAAFRQALARLPAHAATLAGLAGALRVAGRADEAAAAERAHLEATEALAARNPIEAAVAASAADFLRGDSAAAVERLERALGNAPAGSSGWTIPVEPLFHNFRNDLPFERVLARVRNRAA